MIQQGGGWDDWRGGRGPGAHRFVSRAGDGDSLGPTDAAAGDGGLESDGAALQRNSSGTRPAGDGLPAARQLGTRCMQIAHAFAVGGAYTGSRRHESDPERLRRSGRAPGRHLAGSPVALRQTPFPDAKGNSTTVAAKPLETLIFRDIF